MEDPNDYWESAPGRRLKLRDLNVLAAVVRWGSMASAARHLGMSQPAVSKFVSDLEHALRVRLLDRSSQGVEPTIYARALLKRGSVAFDELRQGIRDIEHLADPSVGEIRLASQELLAAAYLPAVIDSFAREYPKVVVNVQAGASTHEFRDLRARRIDLVVARLPASVQDDDLAIENLFDDERELVVTGANSPWARRHVASLAELVNEPWVLSPSRMVTTLISEAFGRHGLELPARRITATSVLIRNHLLATGRFLSVLPSFVMQQHARQWSLQALPIDIGGPPRLVGVVTLKNRTTSAVVGPFIQHLRLVAKGMFAPAAAEESPRSSSDS